MSTESPKPEPRVIAEAGAPAQPPRLVVERVTKRFGQTLALSEVSLTMRAGEVHALMGENGAGKSTLGKAIAGLHPLDEGRILVDGRVLPAGSVHAAARMGVRIVHQELAQCPNLTVAENLCLHEMPTAGPSLFGLGIVSREAARTRARRLLRELDPHIDVDAPLGTLAPGRRQIVQIAASLDEESVDGGVRIIVFDEPTSSLSVVEADRLMQIVRSLAARGILCIYVSHRMNEIFSCCDRVSVLRDGRYVGTGVIRTTGAGDAPAERVDEGKLVSWMIGRTLSSGSSGKRVPGGVARAAGTTGPALEVRGMSSPGRLRGVSLTVNPGEILGVGGLVGAGRSELLDAIFGLDSRATGEVRVVGSRLSRPGGGVKEAIAAGVGYVPEDRRLQGLFFQLGVDENVIMPVMPGLARAGFRAIAREVAAFRAGVERFRIKTASNRSTPGELSGGNQQKLLLARWMHEGTRVLLLDEPTRGIDVGTKSEIHRLIAEAADAGAAVLLVSSEMPELLALSDRIVVLAEGELTGELRGEAMTQENILRLATRSAVA